MGDLRARVSYSIRPGTFSAFPEAFAEFFPVSTEAATEALGVGDRVTGDLVDRVFDATDGNPYAMKLVVAQLTNTRNLDEVKRAFLKCHRIIWKAEKMSPQAAFDAFAKLLFVKLWEDRKLRDDPETLALIGRGDPIPTGRGRFSMSWIADQEANDPNPVGDILFRQLVDFLEEEIAKRKRKRIFEPGERLGLGPGTIKRVVGELENFYLFGIDEELNGRMFEAFLTATMRGQDLGQYFTPRSIVKLMSKLAEPVASPQLVERVLDACCGTGGFLIEALTDMRAQIYANASLSKSERQKLLEQVANEAIFGIDAGKDPPIARIARINMYLHGDGGSRIYTTDGLRLVPQSSGVETLEVRQEIDELRRLLAPGPVFDVVLTNPPFAMDYSANVPDEADVLEGYDLVNFGGRKRPSLRSTVMFLERYWRLLKPGARLLTVIDDSIWSGPKYAYVRDFLRERFLIRAVISLHGDAFQRAGARAKTSVLYLTKRSNETESQPAVFVHESRYIGLDDVVPSTRPSVAERARASAEAEREEIIVSFREYQHGVAGPWLGPAEQLSDRFDAKFLRPWSVRELEPTWKAVGAISERLGNLVDLVEDSVSLDPDREYQFLRISYLGHAEGGERSLGKEVSYSRIGRPSPGDIVVSNISAVYGSICVLPEGFEHLLTSNEFTVLRLKDEVDADPFYLWSVLRTSGVIAEWLSSTTGVGRHRVNWETLQDQCVPLLSPERQRAVGDLYRKAWERSAEAERLQK